MAAAQQYLGNKLCLVSKALLRYEGILHSIDPVKASLTLANVKCFGTEIRSKDFIPPSEVIYGHISFKGENLKDIFMCDEKKSDLPDPAIIEHSDPVRPNSASSSISYSNLISSVGRVAATTTQPTFVPTPIGMPPSTYNFMGQNHEDINEHNINQQQSLPSSRSVSPLHNHHHYKKSPTNDQSTQMTPMTKDYSGPSTKYRPGGDYHQTGHNNNNMGGGGRRDNFNQTRVGPPPLHHNYHNSNQHQQQQHNFQGGNYPNYNSNRFGGNGNGSNYNRLGTGPPKYHQGGFGNQGQQRTVSAIGNRPHTSTSYHHMHAGGGRASNPNKDLLTKTELKQYTEEFNFEEMNAQFNKESLHKEFEEKLKIDAAKKLSSALPKPESTDQTLLPTTAGEPKDEAAGGEDGKDHPREMPELGGVDEEKPKDHDDDQEIDSPIFYNKAKSFFDNISCQTNRTHLAKAPFRQFFPQKINTETFGLNQQQQNQYPSGSGRLGGAYGASYPSGQYGAGPSGGRFHQGVPGYRNFGGQQSLATGRFSQFQRQWNYGQQQNASRKFGGPSSNAAVKVGAAH